MVLVTSLDRLLSERKDERRKKMSVITPSMRPENLLKIKESMNFDYINEWIVVYDLTKVGVNRKLFDDAKIKEYFFSGEGDTGNPQRNYGIEKVSYEDTYLYFLDDDNCIHPNLYRLLDVARDFEFYTFDQAGGLKGRYIEKNKIDTAMFLVDFKAAREVRWVPYCHAADFYYVNDCYSNSSNGWVYVEGDLCYYNRYRDVFGKNFD